MKRLASVVTITTYLFAFVLPDLPFRTVHAQSAPGQSGGPQSTSEQPAVDIAQLLGLGPAARPARPQLARPASAGQPSILNANSPLSTAVMTAVGGRGTQFSEVTLFADWDGREDLTADRSKKVDDFSTVETDIDATLTRTAISAHTVANGFNENVYYYGDSVGNVFVGVDTNPGSSSGAGDSIDAVTQLHLPTLMNAFGTLNSDDQVVVTGLCVNPVADLSSFANVNGAFAPFSGRIGEILYVTFLDTGGGLRLSANNILVRSGVLAFPIADVLSPAQAPPAIQSVAGFPVTVGGAFGVAFSVFHNVAGCAVDDDGNVYFHQVDLTQLTGANIVKITDIGTNQDRSHATNGFLTITTLNPAGGLYGTASGPVTQVNRFTNYSRTAPNWGNITALAAGPGNVLYAAMAASRDGTSSSGPFDNGPGLGPTPSKIITFADGVGTLQPDPSVTVPDGVADPVVSGPTIFPGVNNLRVFALGNGPDVRALSGQSAAVYGTPTNTLKLDFQIDYTIYSGLAVNEDRQVFVISGGTPAGVGRDPSPTTGEIIAFSDNAPADLRGDYVDFRGNQVPNPPVSGGNVGDGDSDRFDHTFLQAPNDGVTITPTGLAGLSRGFLRYTNRLAPNPISPGVVIGGILGQTGGPPTQGDDDVYGPIFFSALDPGRQADGGDDQNPPFRGDDSDGGGFPAIPGALNGGFEFNFAGLFGGFCAAPWNAFFLNSNGNLTFNGFDFSTFGTPATFLGGLPRVAGAWGNLLPSARTLGNLNQFPVQALGFAGVNHFKVRWINVPRSGQQTTGSRSTFSISLFDDGTGTDENANQALNPANPIGNNTVPFDRQEGPTDLHYALGPAGIIGNPPRPEGSSRIVLEYGWMDTGANLNNFIAGYSIGQVAGVPETNLSEVGRLAILGAGIELAIYEHFSATDWDLRSEGADAAAATPAGQPDLNREILTFFGKNCGSSLVSLNVQVTPSSTGTITGPGIACPGDCQENLFSGSLAGLTATPGPGYVFGSWTGCDAPAANTCTMFMNGPRQAAANFVAVPAPLPLQVALNGSAFSTGQVLIANVTLNPALSGPGPVDAYIVVDIPGGMTFSLQLPIGANVFVPGQIPIAANFIPFAFSGPVVNLPLSGVPPGTYTFRTFLTQPGTLTVIGSPSMASFTFTP